MTYRPTWNLSTIPDDALHAEAARRRAAKGAGRPPVTVPCPFCRQSFGARALREHVPRCDVRKSAGLAA